MRVVVPASRFSDANWTRTAESCPQVRFAVLDIGIHEPNPDTATAAARVQAGHEHGIKTLGYVPTDSGRRTKDDVNAMVDAFYSLCAPDGIFFDQGPPPAANQDVRNFYRAIYSHVKELFGDDATVMMNAADLQDEWIMGPDDEPRAADVALLWEERASQYEDHFHRQPWLDRYPAGRIGHTVHTCPTPDRMRRVVALARERNCGHLYVYDGTSAAYNRLPSYWDDLRAAVTPPPDGYWLCAGDGGVFALGEAPFHGSAADISLNKPVVGMAATPTGDGYWLCAADGGVFAMGDAPFWGSAADINLNQPVVGMAASASGDGYWLCAGDGGVFTFGDAPFRGSAADINLNKPVVGMAATSSGDGYWLCAGDGGVFTFGDAPFHGSAADIHLNKPVVGMAATPSGDGYWLCAADGGVFSFGDAPFFGSAAGIHLNKPVVGMAMASAEPAPGTSFFERRITCIVKGSDTSPSTRIGKVGGRHPDGESWAMTVNEAIIAIESGAHHFYVEEPVGDRVEVVVARKGTGAKYLKTEPDGDEPNNLLALPRCS